MQPGYRNYPCISVDSFTYGVINNNEVNVKIGSRVIRTKVLCNSEERKSKYNTVNINKAAATELMVLKQSFLIYKNKGGTIYIGPSVGILTTGNNKKNPYLHGKKARIYKELISYSKEKGIFVFYFYPNDINWNKMSIRGYTIGASGTWISGTFGMPDMVYNRVQYRSEEKKNTVQSVLERFNKNGIYLFNSRFLNKWEVFKALCSYPEANRFLPRTALFNKVNLKKFVSQFSEVFIKPQNSSKGQGIIKIVSDDENGYRFALAESSNKSKWIKCNTVSTLYEKLNPYITKESNYLVQEGIRLAQYNGRVFDLRTQVQKNGQGEWVLTGIGVRVAGKERFVTHIPNGGTAARFEEVIENTFAGSPEADRIINQKLNKICTVIPPVLEKELGLNLGILSLDIGIDRHANLWVLEVNSKPASFDENDIRKRHLNLLTDYFIFVAQEKG